VTQRSSWACEQSWPTGCVTRKPFNHVTTELSAEKAGKWSDKCLPSTGPDGNNNAIVNNDGMDVFATGDSNILPVVDDAQCAFALALFASAVADRVEGGFHGIPMANV